MQALSSYKADKSAEAGRALASLENPADLSIEQGMVISVVPSDAASRAYRCMERAAGALLLADGQRLRKHQEVIGSFGRLFAKPKRVGPRFHRYLIADFDLRNVAEDDPLPEPPPSTDRAGAAVQYARKFWRWRRSFGRSQSKVGSSHF